MSTPENNIVPAASPGRRAGAREPAQDPGMSARVEQQLALAESSRPTSTQSTPRRSPQELVPRSTQSSPGRPTLREFPALPQPPLELALSPAAESTLGKRDHLALRGHHETTVPGNGAPVRLGLAPGAQVLGPEVPAPRGHALPKGSLPVIPRGVSGEAGAGSGQLVSFADDEARAYGVEQLRRWVALPGEVISPVDVVYDEAEDEYDMEAWVKAALETSRYLGLLNAGRLSEPWICWFDAGTMLMEAGFEFCNVVPIWSSIPELAAVSENQIRRGVEEVQARIAVECLEWNKLIRGVGFHIRQPLDPLPEVRPVSPADNQACDEEGDILMIDDTVGLLGLELTMKLRQLQSRLPAPIRAWYKQLPERDQKSRLSMLFRREYCRTEASPYGRYYELSPDSGETARSFLYRLNAAAKRADVDYEGSASDRELHIRRFIKKISDRRLKITLQGQRFLSIRELEKTLKRTHGVRFSRFPSQRRRQPERSYLSAGEDSDSGDEDAQAQESEDKPESAPRPGTPPPVSSRPTATVNIARIPEAPVPTPRAPTTEEIFRAVEQMGWRPPLPPAPPQSPRRDNNVFCEKCRAFGHSAQYCWQDAVRELARKGALQDLPDGVLK
ncbi:hypothetical protein PHYSODRAFT_324671 [Phytophthora sojae]|uniref:Uncharacterized protein n=1 Tax=Phytophthora sojae (strain P6497) TaxID=1094619 RepID=G4YRJ4_PHYSP|nr:hypothetical protein PHYSODRAFT_324671 [Phytophthora sojae]EGZ23459.1 hypothetical protein PHYSODRAFT_324671 [Phytophthora sojae]|eukprot:XP_009518747.1 hypothetical protein PHYSODRAFT_324671 [Phytophthora sojae]